MDDTEARDRVGRIEGLLEEIESLADPVARDRATETVQVLLDLYGEGLARVLAAVGEERARAAADDELVAHLLLLHGLHPVPVEVRVHDALEEVRPYLGSHGGNVQLLGVEEGVVRLRLEGSCSGCPSSAMTLKLAIEEAIFKAAPDVESVEAEDADAGAQPPATVSGIPLPIVQVAGNGAAPGPANGDGPGWATAGGLPELSGGGKIIKDVAGEPLLFLRLEADYFAYRPQCPGCGASLEDAALEAAELSCAECDHVYDARRAGRCLDRPQLHLEPVPLLVGDSGLVKVAVGATGS